MAQPLYPGCDVWLNNPLRPLRGLRHVRHEGRAERRPQPVDPRRLVGRVVRRRLRLGDPVRRRRRRPRPPRRPRGGRALRPDRERRSRRGSTTATPPASRALDRDGPPHAASRSARRCWPAGWCATTSSSSTRPARRSRRGRSTATYAGARELAAWKQRVRAAWPRSGSTTSRLAGVGDAPRARRPRLACGRSCRSATCARGRRRRRWCTAGSTTTTTLTDVQRSSLSPAEAYDGGRHRYEGTSTSTAPARSATPSASCPKHAAPGQPGRARPGRHGGLTPDRRSRRASVATVKR